MRFGFFLLLSLSAAAAWPQTYPSKPVRVVVPYPAGSTPDIIGRTLAERLQKTFGQPFVVENRSGAGGSIGAEAVAKAPADGHTLLIGGNGPVAINKHLYKTLGYDPDRELAPISLLATAPQLLVARPGLKLDDFKAEVPSVAELGMPALESLAWNGLLAPAGTPANTIARVGSEAVRAMRSPETLEALGRLGFEVVASSPAEFSRWIRAESEKWARVIRASGATAD
jgi:tripartite-type tricarboxylate transporter receptor subunit TctC